MAAHPENFRIEDGVLKWVSDDYIKKNNGHFEIPNSVTIIGEHAFSYCTSLKQVTIPHSVITIKYCAFAGCANLEQVTIPRSVRTIGNWAFSKCTCLEQVTIPDSVTIIGIHSFVDCANLKQVTIPDSVIHLGGREFRNCHKDLEITIPTMEASEEKAKALKEKLQKNNPNIKIYIDNPLNHLRAIVTFFPQTKEQQEGEPSPNNSPR